MRRAVLTVLAILLVSAARPCHGAPAPTVAPLPPADQARLLQRWAAEALESNTVDARARAQRLLEDAIGLEPDGADHWRLLGTVHAQGRFFTLARQCYERARELAPDDAAIRVDLGMEFRREWETTLVRDRLLESVAEFDTATRLQPSSSEAWLRLAPLRYELGDVPGALAAARSALPGRWTRVEAQLAVAYLSYRVGDVELADSLFRIVIPRLEPSLRHLFEDPHAMADAGDPVSSEERRASDPSVPAGSRWAARARARDPDAPIDEIPLEYWSRVAHAYLLFEDALQPGLDARAVTYARYGPPATVRMNPPGVANTFQMTLPEHVVIYKPESLTFPFEVQAWDYPQLGMRVLLADRTLNGRYVPAPDRYGDPSRRPDPHLLAAQSDLLALDDDAIVFPTRPPHDQRLDVRGRVARFSGEHGPRVLIQVAAPGTPADTLTAWWRMTDAAGRRLAGGHGTLVSSACDPEAGHEGQFGADVPPGVVRVVVTVHDTRRHRGGFADSSRVAPVADGFAMSDLVVSCGDPGTLVGGNEVRLGVNPGSLVARGEALVLYTELYGLMPGPDGLSRFEYTYEVRAAGAPAVVASGTRAEEQTGTLRRQFVRVPVADLPPGAYRVTLRVRDRVADRTVTGTAAFTRE